MSDHLQLPMNNDELHISDLIQLFLDGESTDIENDLLFSALAQNKMAQAEFQSAVRTGALLRTVAQTHQPPVELSSLVMQKVGFSIGAGITAGTAATSIATTTGFSLWLRSLPALLQSGKVMALVGFLTVATVGSYFYLNSQNTPSVSVEQASTEHSSSTSVSTSASNTAASSASSSEQASTPLLSEKQSSLSSTAASSASASVGQFAATTHKQEDILVSRPSTQLSGGGTVSSRLASLSHATKHYAQKTTLATTEEPRNGEGTIAMELSPVAPQLPARISFPSGGGLTTKLQPSTADISSALLKPDITDDGVDMTPDAIWLRSMSALSHYPQRSSAQSGNFADLDLCILFKVGKGLSAGVEFGSEFLPSYVLSTNGNSTEYILQERIGWGGFTLWYDQSSPLLFDELHSFASASMGQSNAGPLAKAQAGIYCNVFDDFHIGTSVDGTLLLFKTSSGWQSAGRNGISLVMGYRF